MSTQQIMCRCDHCQAAKVHLEERPNGAIHIIICILTLGAWLPVWVGYSAMMPDPQCTECGMGKAKTGKDYAMAVLHIVAALAMVAIIWAVILWGG